MSEKSSLKDWLGFKGVEEAAPNPVDRIRELESQLSDLRSRRDITSLNQEEFEILATETAITIIKSAQGREAKAKTLSDRILNESARQAKSTIDDAQLKAATLQASAQAEGQKYVADAQAHANSTIAASKQQAAQIVEAAQRESKRLTEEAAGEVAEYRQWLAGLVSETERHHKVQVQALATAEGAILQSRSQLESAFDRLVELKNSANGSPAKAVEPPVKPTLVQVPAEVVQETLDESTDPTISVLPTETVRSVGKRTADSRK